MVIVDTSVWSLVLRRSQPIESSTEKAAAKAFAELSRDGQIGLLGLVRQELLSGISSSDKFNAIKAAVAHFDDVAVLTADYEQAAEFNNTCRKKGIQGAHTDYLICGVAYRLDASILSTDKDFMHYAQLLPIRLHPAMQVFSSI